MPFVKEPDPEDPMQLDAECVNGDPLIMLDSLIEEFAHIGLDSKQIKSLFDNPFFIATHGLSNLLESQVIQDHIDSTLKKCGVFRFKMMES